VEWKIRLWSAIYVAQTIKCSGDDNAIWCNAFAQQYERTPVHEAIMLTSQELYVPSPPVTINSPVLGFKCFGAFRHPNTWLALYEGCGEEVM
jgi:hypothetical protein